MFVVFLHGPAAAGKHTVGSWLSETTGLPLFHNHLTVDLVKELFEFGSEGFVELREEIWLASFRAAAKAGRSLIFTFHPEASVRPSFIAAAQRVVGEFSGRIYFVELVCSEETVESRIDAPSRARFGKLRDVDFYRTLREQGAFEFPPLPEPLVRIDSDKTPAEDAARRIREVLEGLEPRI